MSKVAENTRAVLSDAMSGVSHAIVALRDMGQDESAEELMLFREVLVQWCKRAVRRAGAPMGRRAVPPIAGYAGVRPKPAQRKVLDQRAYAVLLKQLQAEVANG